MKTLNSTLLLVFLLFISFVVQANIQKKKEIKMQACAEVDSVIYQQKWVLEANQVIRGSARNEHVSDHINFISLNGNKVVIQIGSCVGLDPVYGQSIINDFETNNVGGMTIEGEVTKYKVKKLKNDNYIVYIHLNSILGAFEIRLDCNKRGVNAIATIRGNSMVKLQYIGDINKYSNSTTYTGRAF